MKSLTQLYKNLGLSKKNGLIEFKEDWEKNIKFSLKIISQLKIIKPKSFYHFNNIPLILFFENPDKENEKRIHKQVWCFNKAPIIFVLKAGIIEVYNAFRYEKDKIKSDEGNLKKLEISNEDIIKQFSFLNIESGNTWKWIENKFYKKRINEYKVDSYLLANIRTAVNKLEEEGLKIEDANKLILRLIFSRYLIDREVILDKKFIKGEPEEREKRKESLNELIRNKKALYRFFDYLKERFNGNLFDINENTNDVDEKRHLGLLSGLFKGEKLEKEQPILFNVYDFSIIPIELISGIYESIIDEKKRKDNSAIFTPAFLVDYILENTIEKFFENEKNTATDCKILDPACGSGIFLVESYRRIVEKEKLNFRNNKQDFDRKLIELLENNIYGVDKDINALNVAIFSLYIALLDYKKPKDIDKIQLPKLLNLKLFEADFFDVNHKFNDIINDVEIKFVVGNPPWGSKPYNENKEEIIENRLHNEYIGNNQLPVANYEISQTFLLRLQDFYNEEIEFALIVKSSSLFNSNSKNFRNYFLDKFFINLVCELSASRMIIFKDVIAPASIIFYKFANGKDTSKNIVNHYSIKPNLFLKLFNVLVFEKEDIKSISQNNFIKYHWLWKVALYGNTIDFHFLKRLKNIKETIEKYIKKNNNLIKGKGIIKGTPKENQKPFTFLEGLPLIELDEIMKYYTFIDDNIKKIKKEDTYLERGRTPELFLGKHIFFKNMTKDESELVVSYIEKDCVFKNDSCAITSKSDINNLLLIYGLFISKLFTYFQFLTSSGWGVYYPKVTLEEFFRFPCIPIQEKEKFIALVDNFINHYKNYYEKYPNISSSDEIPFPKDIYRDINKIVNNTYEVDETEEDLIDYVLDVSRYLFQEKKAKTKALRRVDDDDLKKYARIFYDHFSNVYNSKEEYFQIEYFQIDFFIAMKFKIVTEKPSEENEIVKSNAKDEIDIFKALALKTSIYNITRDIFTSKLVKGFEEDFFYIIKPNEYKSWHRAVAHYDLAEFVNDIMKAEFELNTGNENE